MSKESCVETPAAPEWLSKLEDRREKLKRATLGHEAGAGAPCSECGDKCPGLDLHFWRKVCRNCKCRKDQHLCTTDDNLHGWAQFEILGQIRSKPAFIKIKALASQSVLVEWVPPNVATDLATDYMEKLGANNVPVTGSKAATKRKQQLEFQVPPHDLDANLCDNLSESESQQLQQYVQKLREHCVGQGSVVRVGNYGQGILTRMPPPEPDIYPHPPPPPPEVEDKVLRCLQSELTEPIISSSIEQDAVLSEIVAHPKIAQAILQPVPYSYPKIFMVFREPFIEVDHREKKNELMMSTTGGDRSFDDPHLKTLIRPQMIEHLHGFNKAVIRSAVIHGPIYDRIFEILKESNLDVTRDPRLGPLADLRNEYNDNPAFRAALDSDYMMRRDDNDDDNKNPMPLTPIKSSTRHEMSYAFNSPLAPIQHANRGILSGQLIHQETPVRRIQKAFIQDINNGNLDKEQEQLLTTTTPPKRIRGGAALALPSNVDYSRDPIFSAILDSFGCDEMRVGGQETTALQNNSIERIYQGTPSIKEYSKLSESTQKKLQQLNVYGMKLLQSVILNAPFYERLFESMTDHHQLPPVNRIDEGIQCVHQLLDTLQNDRQMYDELRELVMAIPSSLEMAYAPIMTLTANNSQSPRTYPFNSSPTTKTMMMTMDSTSEPPRYLRMKAEAGKYEIIPGIEEMNMYPTVQPSSSSSTLRHNRGRCHPPPPSMEDEEKEKQTKESNSTVTCKNCGIIIRSGEVVVRAARAGKEISWHPACFKCAECHELLADLVYFFHGGQVYCGRDLATKLNIPRCKACDELIFTKEYTAAEGCTFHIKHFCCFQCDLPLAGQQYVPDEKTNMPLCLPCYDQFYAASCQRCHQSIGPADQGVSWSDLHWHSKCFLCANKHCEGSLIGRRFCMKNNQPFCSAECIRHEYP